MGTYIKRSENSYQLRTSCGYDKNGKQIRKTKTIKLKEGLTTKQKEKELQKQLVLFEQAVTTGTYLDGEKTTFEELTNMWLENYAEKNLAPSTLVSYKSKLNHRIIPALGHLKISKIQPHHLMSFYNNLSEDGIRLDSKCVPTDFMIGTINNRHEPKMQDKIGISTKTYIRARNGEKISTDTAKTLCGYYSTDFKKSFKFDKEKVSLSKKTIRHHHDIISTILASAVKWNLITNNPAERVEPIKLDKTVVKYYDNDDIIKLFDALEDAPITYKTLVYLAVDTGLRSGEIAGLKWTDINYDKSLLYITGQRQYINGYGTIDRTTKTDSGVRYVTVSDTMLKMLKKYQIKQKTLKLQLGTAYTDSNYVFTHDDGVPLHPHRPYTWFKDLLKQHGLKDIRFHDLRHTNASLLIADGIDVVTLSGRLGHADKSVTLNVYSHIIKANEKRAANTMDKFYKTKKL